ncbi:hypothetical protein WKK05_25855 [Nostoc sp. UHCC 0302]|uniref:hypothetical protein n=1 Tax=Nostoc sp. UHCC 0302 TaxID=3134896 RepID=UPI00311CCC7E
MLPKILFKHPLNSTLSKIKNSVLLSGKNPGFLANTFYMSQFIDEVKKVKRLSHSGFSDSDRVVKKMDKVELKAYHQAARGYP